MYALVRIIECKKKKKSTMHIMTRLKCRGKLGRGGLKGGHGWLNDNLGVMKCTLCTEHEVTSRNFIVGCPSHKAESITFHEKSRAHKKAEILLILLFVEL